MKKIIVPVIGVIVMAVFTVFQEAMVDNHISAQEWVQVILGVLMAFNVWATANLPGYGSLKTYVAAAIAVATGLYTFIVGGVSMGEYINLGIILLMALGVALPKQPATTIINGEVVAP
jgi:hypothetical protein